MRHRLFAGPAAFVCLLGASCASAQPAPASRHTTAPIAGLAYDAPFFPGATYDPAIPTPESVLGFRVGDRAAKHAEIARYFQALAKSSDRATLFTHGKTHEGRTLYHLAISSPANIRRLDEIKAGMAKLADPRTLARGEGEKLVKTLPAIAWLAYSIHGDETSGPDASMAVAHYLIASTDPSVRDLLDSVVVVIDPMMNPDGRDRYLQMVAEHRAANPNIDDQSLLHTGYWPAGRGNHYLFDMNRDWIFGTQPETRGRIKAVSEWNPLLFVDAHEMGPQDTYLFSPAREPINPYMPDARRAWWDLFAKDQAAAFDRHGWRYYTGEWAENWYPGYSDAWATYRGAVGILYEQAGLTEDGVLRNNGRVMTYREAVQHQAVSSMANVKTFAAHREELLRGFLAERRSNLKGGVWGANRVYAIPPGANAGRFAGLIDLLKLEGVELYSLRRSSTAGPTTDQLGRVAESHEFPAGTILIPAAQPEAPLVRALLEFDPHMTDEFLQVERRELLRFGRSKLYDVTGWNLTMLFGVEAFMLDEPLPTGAEPYTAEKPHPGGVDNPEAPVGFVIAGADDRAVAAAARLMERGVEVRVADRPFRFDEVDYPRGSVVVTRTDNRGDEAAMLSALGAVCTDLGLRATGFASGLAPGDLADLGGSHFVLLDRPRIAIVTRTGVSPTDAGSTWFTIDQRLGVRATLLDIDTLGFTDLRRYNVLVLPETNGDGLDDSALEKIRVWVNAGGTVIAVGSSAAMLAREKPGLSSVRLLPDVLEDLAPYRTQIVREWLGRTSAVDPSVVWSNTPADADAEPLTTLAPPNNAHPDELTRADQWRSIFMPQGAIVAGRADDRNWLTFGVGAFVPIVFGDDPILMTDGGADAAVRLGVYNQTGADDARNNADDAGAEPGPRWVGWAPVPEGHELRLRMSGLLWPEAAQRIANAAYLTAENQGRGQVILFASPPTFRAAAMGTTRLFINAVVFGPGFASAHVIEP